MTEQQDRRANIIRKAIAGIEEKLGRAEMKPTLADLVRLLQIEKELGADEPREIRVTWIDPGKTPSLIEN